ncbi:MAG: carbohydrate kinase family protein [Proteobacteria bacterium]|nr:carbohydrate kinase family protein [Pseudomonadota bacterium]MDE3208889.1 carbohydrate kinase family protein [Pseudomonadota bacterium]
MSILICGSMAYDTIMVFPEKFQDHILPDRLHILNVSFLVPEMRREYGGCAGNIAYNLHLIGIQGSIMATVGDDFSPYAERLGKLGLSLDHISRIDGTYTAQAFITTDVSDNQITAFHPGAMSYSHVNHVYQAQGTRLGIVSPDGREGMLQHAAEFEEAGIPFIFDPGQGLPMFSGDDLLALIRQASYVTVNDYEAGLLTHRTGLSQDALASEVKALVVTQGEAGATIYADGKKISIPVVVPHQIVDPTGCGDAFRAGLLYGLDQGLDWTTTGNLASLMGSLKIASRGGQNHVSDRQGIFDMFHDAFGYSLN